MITLTLTGHNIWAVESDGQFAGALRWHGACMRMVSPDGELLGSLFRSDGKIQPDGSIVYTWRAYLAGGAEVARGATREDAVAAILRGTP